MQGGEAKRHPRAGVIFGQTMLEGDEMDRGGSRGIERTWHCGDERGEWRRTLGRRDEPFPGRGDGCT